jgi:hypothetical protein
MRLATTIQQSKILNPVLYDITIAMMLIPYIIIKVEMRGRRRGSGECAMSPIWTRLFKSP